MNSTYIRPKSCAYFALHQLGISGTHKWAVVDLRSARIVESGLTKHQAVVRCQTLDDAA